MKNKRISGILLVMLLVLSLFSGCAAEESMNNMQVQLETQEITDNAPVVQKSSFSVAAYPVDLQYTEYVELVISEELPVKPVEETTTPGQEKQEINVMPAEGQPEINSPTEPTTGENNGGQEIIPARPAEKEIKVIVFRGKKANVEDEKVYYRFQIHKQLQDKTVILHATYYPGEGTTWDEAEESEVLLKAKLEAKFQEDLEWITCSQESVYARNQSMVKCFVFGQNVLYANAESTVFQIQTYGDDGVLCNAVELSPENAQMLHNGVIAPVEWSEDCCPVMQFEKMEIILSDDTIDLQVQEQMVVYEEYIEGLLGKIEEEEQTAKILHMAAMILAATNLIFLILLLCRKRRKTGRRKSASRTAANQHGAEKVRKVGVVHNIGSRSGQQDSFDVINCNAGTLAVVADGMGGLSDGDKVSQKIVATMRADSARIRPGKTENVLCQMVAHANQEVNRMLGAARQYKCGSTLLAVLVEEGQMQWITVGDSRIYLYRGGKLLQINREHIYCAELLEHAINGKIGFAEAMRDPQADRLSSFIGMGELKHVDICLNKITLCAGDYILLMSDGVFNTLTDDQIADTIRTAPNASEAANILETKILQKKAPNQDNFTCVILEI